MQIIFIAQHYPLRPNSHFLCDCSFTENKLLFFGTYHSTHPLYGLTDTKYFEQLGLALYVYINYDKFLFDGDYNVEDEEDCLREFLIHYNAKNLVKENPCF